MNKDTVSYSIVLAASAFFLAMTSTIASTEVTVVNSSLFPRILLIGMILMSAIGLFKAIKSGERTPADKVYAPLFIGFGFLIGFILLLRFAGFVVAAGTFIATFSLYMMGTVKPKMAAIMFAGGFAVSFGIDYIFTNILSFILP